jgi:hypothetical protein
MAIVPRAEPDPPFRGAITGVEDPRAVAGSRVTVFDPGRVTPDLSKITNARSFP